MSLGFLASTEDEQKRERWPTRRLPFFILASCKVGHCFRQAGKLETIITFSSVMGIVCGTGRGSPLSHFSRFKQPLGGENILLPTASW
jgi:hypothetical protein